MLVQSIASFGDFYGAKQGCSDQLFQWPCAAIVKMAAGGVIHTQAREK
jgi:hypothetical protein